jgi:hypothetical protein
MAPSKPLLGAMDDTGGRLKPGHRRHGVSEVGRFGRLTGPTKIHPFGWGKIMEKIMGKIMEKRP